MALTRVGGAVKSDRIFDTVAAMVASKTVKVGDIVETAGYTTVNDGGGAKYEIVAAATGTDDGGSFIDLDTHQAKALLDPVADVKQFGAVGDGVANDTQSIQNSQDNHGNNSIPSGTYDVTSLTFSKFGNTLYGVSQYDTTIKGLSSSSTVLSTNNYSGVQLKNLRIDGDNLSSVKGLLLDDTFYSTFENVDIRNTTDHAVEFVNSNNNTFNSLQAHNVGGNGFVLDATSQHNTFNASGVEDFSGEGIDCNGIGNIFNAPWIENRDSATYATDEAININNRDNIVLAPEIRGSVAKPMSKGIVLGSFSGNTMLVNPNFADVTTEIELLGTDLYRNLQGVDPTEVTNTGGDTTTLIQKGNHIYTDMTWVSSAPVLNFESENGTSGARFNLEGTASSDNFRWQVGGTTYLQLNNSKHFTPGSDNTQNLGSGSLRWATVYAGTGTINTSDERSKSELLDINETERLCAKDLKTAIKKFKFKDSVEAKGEEQARIHFGVGAQTVKNIFESHGLNPNNYALFCYDEWEDIVEEGRVVKEAGNRYGIRYGELLCFIIAAL